MKLITMGCGNILKKDVSTAQHIVVAQYNIFKINV